MGKVLSQGWGSFRDASGDVSRAALAAMQGGTVALLLTFLACQALAATGSAKAESGVRAGGAGAKAPVATMVAHPGNRSNVVDATTDSDADGEPDFAEIRLGIYGINGSDADLDGLSDSQEDANHNGTVDPGESNPALADSDGDGLADGTDPWPVSLDGDNDGISDAAETSGYTAVVGGISLTVTTDPRLSDTDGDGLSDGVEVRTWFTNPTVANTDGDGWNDGDEVLIAGTNPNVVDTDGDGINDGIGFEASLVDVDADGRINPLDNDSDNDGLRDGVEDANHNGVVDATETSPILYDTDGDGLSDGYEVHTGNNALGSVDGDGDGINDGLEITTAKTDPADSDTDNDGILDGAEMSVGGVLDVARDTDGDGIINALDTDSDNDGMTDAQETAGYTAVVAGVTTNISTDPYLADTDGDGLSDGFEQQTGTNGSVADTDADGVNDGAEVRTWGTNPVVADTDGDGFNDGAELVGVVGTDVDNDGRNNALDTDSDGDGILDSAEAGYGTQPYNADSDIDDLTDGEEIIAYHTNPTNPDTDGDGLADGVEVFGVSWHGHPIYLNPNSPDTDGDGVSDGTEVNVWQTDPGCKDTDGDGINDGAALSVSYINAAGETVSVEYHEDNADGDLDLLNNALDSNSDYSRYSTQLNKDLHDRTELFYGNALSNPHRSLGWILNPGALDTDGDGLSDAKEILDGSDPLDARIAIQGPEDIVDPDGDGLYSYEEVILGTDPANIDSDGDGLYDGEEIDPLGIDVNHDGLSGTAADNADGVAELDGTNPLSSDTDADGLLDAAEYAGGTQPNCEDSDNDGVPDGTDGFPIAVDIDGDRLIDSIEATLGTNPNLADTDGDGLNDSAEYVTYSTDPLTDADADGDGLKDGAEVLVHGTDPHLTDSDFDGQADGAEFTTTLTNPAKADTDGDLLFDGFELAGGWNPLLLDTDADGLVDGAEVALHTNGLVADTDLDGINDGVEVTVAVAAGNEALQITAYGADPTKTDTDGDGFWDGTADGFVDGSGNTHESITSDSDGDGISNAKDKDSDNDWIIDGTLNPGSPTLDETYAADADGDGIPNVLDADSDNDGLSDPLEIGIGTSLTNADTDSDGILDGNEWTQPGVYELTFLVPLSGGAAVTNDQIRSLTDPLSADTDGDGIADGREVGLTAAQTSSGATIVADADGFSDSDPRFADTDADGIVDGTEANATGDGTNYGVTVTNPRDADTDDDGLLDASELSWGTIGFNSDTDGDAITDGTEVGLTAPESAGRAIGSNDTAPGFVADADPSSHTNVLVADSDGDGVNDGVEDQNFNGAWDIPAGTVFQDDPTCATFTETNPLDVDSDHDGVNDNVDVSPTCSFAGGNMYSDAGPVAMTMVNNGGANQWAGTTSQTITSTLGDGRLSWLQPTAIMWTGEVPGGYYTTHTDPYDAAAHPSISGLAFTPNCVALVAGANAVTLDLTLPAGTLPGTYQGTVFVVSNSDIAATTCPGPDPMSTLVPYDSFSIEITVPERIVNDINGMDGLANGVGNSHPAGFYAPAAVGEMHLAGYPNYPGEMTGQFQISNPNTLNDVDANGVNDANGLPALPNPRWTRADQDGGGLVTLPANTDQGNVANDVQFRYRWAGIGTTDPTSAITFVPTSISEFGLGTAQSILVHISTANLSASCATGYEGIVEAYYNDGVSDITLDAFSLKFQLKQPDFDIFDNKGDVNGNAIVANLDFATQVTPAWSIVTLNQGPATASNDEADIDHDTNGNTVVGCDSLVDISLYMPAQSASGSFTALGMLNGTTITGGDFWLVSTADATQKIHAQIYSMAPNFNSLDVDQSATFGVRIDKSSLSTNLPTGTYEPWYWSGSAKNGLVFLTGVGASSKASNPPNGFQYDGTEGLSALVDSFRLSVHYTGAQICTITLAPNSISTTMDPGTSKVVGSATVTNAGTIGNLSLSTTGTVLTSGSNAMPVSVTVSPNFVNPGSASTVTVTATASSGQTAGTYSGNVVISPSCGGSSVTLAVSVTVTSRSVAFGPAPAPAVVNPGSTASLAVTVRNDGTAPILAGELTLSLTPFAQSGGGAALLTGSAIPDAAGVTLNPGASQVFTITVPVPAGTWAGNYLAKISATTGNVSVMQDLTVTVNTIVTSSTVSSLNLIADQTSTLTVYNTSNTPVTLSLSTNCTSSASPSFTFSPSSVSNVAPGASVSFNVTPDDHGLAAGTYACTITTTATAGSQSFTQDVSASILVARMPSITVTRAEGGSSSGKAGETVSLKYNINNTGNTPINAGEITTFALDGPLTTADGRRFKTENITITPDPRTIAIPAGGSVTVTVDVMIPVGQGSGTYTTGVTVSGTASDVTLSATSTASVTVTQSRDVEFSQNPVRVDLGTSSVTLKTVDATQIRIYDLLGHLVASHTYTSRGEATWTWTLRSDDGNMVPSGSYTVVIGYTGDRNVLSKLVVIR